MQTGFWILAAALILFIIVFIPMMVAMTYSATHPMFGMQTIATRRKLTQIASDMSMKLDLVGINHTATAGTILGVERHMDVIPHDDDIDIAIHENEVKNVKDMLQQHWPNKVKEVPFGLQIVIDGIKVDFFVLSPKAGDDYLRYRYATPSPLQRKWRTREAMLPEEFNTTVHKPFGHGGTTIRSIQNADRFLSQCFGKHWETTAVAFPPHSANMWSMFIFYMGRLGRERL